MTDDSATGGDVYRVERLCASEEATRDLAARLGALLRGGEILSLVGDLGAGKTTFVRGLAHGLGCENVRLVSSPTYVLEHIYPARHEIHHYDAYRLSCAVTFSANASSSSSIALVNRDREPYAWALIVTPASRR